MLLDQSNHLSPQGPLYYSVVRVMNLDARLEQLFGPLAIVMPAIQQLKPKVASINCKLIEQEIIIMKNHLGSDAEKKKIFLSVINNLIDHIEKENNIPEIDVLVAQLGCFLLRL